MSAHALPRPPPGSDFSLANLPYGVTRLRGPPHSVAPCTRVGDYAVDLGRLVAAGAPSLSSSPSSAALPDDAKRALMDSHGSLNALMALSKPQRVATRAWVSHSVQALIDSGAPSNAVIPIHLVESLLPCQIGDYTDFFASKQHAVNAGTIFRGAANALQPNWLHLPVGYHGRSSSIVVSGTNLHRPRGQLDEGKSYAPCRRLDYELEIGIFLGGQGNKLGEPVSVEEARDMIFGYVLLNDWSARDVQAWEYVPLGPFCAKNFATSISPWIVPAEALEATLAAPMGGAVQSPAPLPYLKDSRYSLPNLNLTVTLEPHSGSQHTTVLCSTNMRNLHWTPAQMIAHHTSTGCNMRPGDLLGSGTVSGTDGVGCLLELTWNGTRPVALQQGGGSRAFLEDGDCVVLRGWAEGPQGRVGFGECRGLVLPPLPEKKSARL